VPGGSSIRDGCYIGKGVTCMPPMYINAGAYVDDGTMVDSHALVEAARRSARTAISRPRARSAACWSRWRDARSGGRRGLVGGNCGIYEGTVVKRRAVLGTGTILNRSTPVYDLVRQIVHRAEGDDPLVIPEEAVIVAGARAITSGPGKDWGISVYTPVIVNIATPRPTQDPA